MRYFTYLYFRLQVHLVNPDLLATVENRDLLDLLDPVVRQENLDLLEVLDLEEIRDHRDQLDLLDPLVSLERLDHKDLVENLELLDVMVSTHSHSLAYYTEFYSILKRKVGIKFMSINVSRTGMSVGVKSITAVSSL